MFSINKVIIIQQVSLQIHILGEHLFKYHDNCDKMWHDNNMLNDRHIKTLMMEISSIVKYTNKNRFVDNIKNINTICYISE